LTASSKALRSGLSAFHLFSSFEVCFTVPSSPNQLGPPLILKYAIPQNMNPNHPSNKLDIKESMSEKKGMTSAMTKAATQVMAIMAHHVAQPVKVLE
jgi:hypothetical protein